jgi:hypothetical protein
MAKMAGADIRKRQRQLVEMTAETETEVDV